MLRSLRVPASVGSVALLLALTACAGGGAPTVNPRAAGAAAASSAEIAPEELELRALLLLMADQKLLDPVTVASAASGGPDLRRRLAFTLARVGDPRGGPALQSLLADDDVRVRRAAAFGLGELAERGDPQAAQALLTAIPVTDFETGRLAVEGAAKAGVPLEQVIQRLLEAPSGEILSRLVPSLFRFDTPAVVRWAQQGLEEEGRRAMAAYALCREPRPEGLDLVRGLLDDADPWIRGLAARALGRVGDRSDLERLRPLLDDSEPGPVIHALRSARALVASGSASAPDVWQPRLLELLEDPRPDVRVTAIEVSGAWLLDPELGSRLERFCRDGETRERELALLALAGAEDPRTLALLPAFNRSDDPVLRRASVRAAALVGAGEVVGDALADPSPAVRSTALETVLDVAADPTETARRGLADDDFVVRSTVLEWAAETPELPYETLAAAYEQARSDRVPDVRLSAIRALRARAEREPLERGTVVALLERIAAEADYLSRREAAAALESLGAEAPRLGRVETGRTIQSYRQIVAQTARPVRYALETKLGTLTLELACPEAPLTCLSFMQLADQGFYDGLRFHRIVPDFVVQGGDPRGDGAGGPGYSLRDELNTLRYEAGGLGMAHAGPDTAGSQFFVTITAQPHLDGAYTVFGRVVEGHELLREWIQGQTIRRVRRVEIRD